MRTELTFKQLYGNSTCTLIVFVDPACLTKHEAQVAIEPRSDQGDEVSHDPSKTTETVRTGDSRQAITGSNETCQSAPVNPEKNTRLTTIAEADSSVRTSPCDSVAFCRNKDNSQPYVVTTTHDKEDERAVSSTKFDSCPVSSLDTMQSVSILASLDYEAAPDNNFEVRQEGARKDEGASSKDIDEVSTKISDAGKEKEAFVVCQGQQTNHYQQSSQTIKEKLPSEIIAGSVKDHETQSLSLEELISLFDERSLSKPLEASPKAVETENVLPDLSKIGKKAVSPREKKQGHQDALVLKSTESDLYERVKQRQRRRPSEMSLQSNRHSDPPNLKTNQLKMKTRKRSADTVAVSSRTDSIYDGNARKKLKKSEGPALHQDSPLKVNVESSQDVDGLFIECKEERDEHVNGSKFHSVKANDRDGALSLRSQSRSSDNTVPSNEMVPASVSSSEKSIPLAINPMIAHVDQASDDPPRGSTENTNEWGSQKRRESNHGEITKNRIFIEDGLQKFVTNEQSPQIKQIQVERKQLKDEPEDKEQASQDAEFTNFGISSPIQQLFSMALQVDGSEKNGIPDEDEEKRSLVEDIERDASSQVSVIGRQEALPLERRDNALMTCYGLQRTLFQEDVEELTTNQSGINDIQKLPSSCSSLDSVPKQKQFTSSFNRHSQEETGTSGSEIEGKMCNVTVEAGGKTSGPSSVDFSDNTPTQSSLDVMDAVTPCLFENDSWETPNRKTSPKKSENKRGPKIASDICGRNYKMASRCSQTLGLSCQTVTEEEKIVEKVGFEGINSLDGSPVEAKNVEQQQFSGVARCSDGSIKELASDAEGTQSYGTSQSISVLQDLEFPLPELQKDADAAFSEQRDEREKSSQNVHEESKGDAPWAEPLPKKLRSGEPLSTSCNLNLLNVTLDRGIGSSIEMTRDSQYTESDVIPPTPPVKPVAKQVFSSRSPIKLSSPKMKPQRKDEATCHSERLVVKQKRLVESTRLSKAVKSHDSEVDRAGARCNATYSEDSVSLLKKHEKISKAPNAHTIDASQTLVSDSIKLLQSSPRKKRLQQIGKISLRIANGLEYCVQSISKEQKRNGASSEMNDSNSVQDKDDIQVSQKERQRVLAHFEVEKRTDSVNRPLGEIQDESVNSSPRNPVKGRVFDIADSFDWSGTKDKGEGERNSQDGSVILIVDDNKDTERVKENEKKDENEALTDGFPKSVAGLFQRNDDRDRILVDVQIGDFRDRDEDVNSPCTYDGGESSSDEALLKPVFLPKEFESGTNATTYEGGAENDEEQETAFSQELIPSENEDEDDDDGITCEYQYTIFIIIFSCPVY